LLAMILVCPAAYSSHKIYLVHGYGSSPFFMKSIEKYLKKNGKEVVNFGYRSVTQDLTVGGDSLFAQVKRDAPDTASFVTHSMGALVLRSMTERMEADSAFPVVRRIVMVAPANKGAELADIFSKGKVWRYVLGPNLQHLTTDSASLANRLPIPGKYEIGVIVGIKGNLKGYNPFIKGDNDGYLTPESARLGTEKETYYVTAEHSMIIHNKKVLRLILKFLQNGTFE
jgi:triacylglycerol esterase/lipase EstA (alpha/beta hydrolase family)